MTNRTCQDCPAPLPPNAHGRRMFCDDCATERVKESKRRWHHRHGRTKRYRKYSHDEIPPGVLTCNECGGLLDGHPIVDNPCRGSGPRRVTVWPPSVASNGRTATGGELDRAGG